MSDPELTHLARAIRMIFFEEKAIAMRKSKYKPQARHDQMKFFLAAAEKCRQLKADPRDYVQAAINYCRVAGGPFCNQLGGTAAEGWYRASLLAKGIDPTTVKRLTEARKQDDPAPVDLIYACDADLQMDLEIGLTLIKLNTGSEDCTTPEALKLLLDDMFEMSIQARGLLCQQNQAVLTRFGTSIYNFYATQPNYMEAARRLHYPIDEILAWIRQHQLTS